MIFALAYAVSWFIASACIVKSIVRADKRYIEARYQALQSPYDSSDFPYGSSDIGFSAFKALAIGVAWPIAIPGLMVYMMAVKEAETYKTPKQLQSEIKRLERELGIGDGKTRRNR